MEFFIQGNIDDVIDGKIGEETTFEKSCRFKFKNLDVRAFS